jgi:hypothetical protein
VLKEKDPIKVKGAEDWQQKEHLQDSFIETTKTTPFLRLSLHKNLINSISSFPTKLDQVYLPILTLEKGYFNFL